MEPEKPPFRGLFLSTPSTRRATTQNATVFLLIQFLSTPSARRATTTTGYTSTPGKISIHALREEGDAKVQVRSGDKSVFLSTPSARRATTVTDAAAARVWVISIHALREEGDDLLLPLAEGFPTFLSTPSARRATRRFHRGRRASSNFYPRPPRGGRQGAMNGTEMDITISIHALREEGDACRFR